MSLVVEFTIEPFVEGEPGPHVRAAVDAARASGLAVDFGPFGTTVSAGGAHGRNQRRDAGEVTDGGDGPDGGDAAVLDAVDGILRAAVAAGATRVSLQVVRSA
ncbi:MAG TPA: hypothetical protein VFI47_08135 [Acidimicrobiales bacterium]|nr:hypothetical protein [Acidimicrobiales bacterium]